MNALCETCEIWDEHHYMNLDDEKKYFLMRMMGDFQDKMVIHIQNSTTPLGHVILLFLMRPAVFFFVFLL